MALLRERVGRELPDQLAQLALHQAAGEVIRQVLEREQNLPLNSYRRTLLAELYGNQGYRSVFLDRWSAVGPRAELLLGELRGAYQQGLDTGPYHLDHLDRLEQQVRSADPLPTPRFPIDASIVEDLSEQALAMDLPDETTTVQALARRVVGLDDDPPAQPGLDDDLPIPAEMDSNLPAQEQPDPGTPLQAGPDLDFQAAIEQFTAPLRNRVRFEMVLCDAYLSYARDMRLGNVSRLSPEQLRLGGGRGQITADRFRETFAAIAAGSVEEFADHLEWLYPTHPQYSLLMASLARYRSIVEAGGWETVTPRSLRPGNHHSRVAGLKERLAIEGFYQGPIDSHYDEALELAVRSYQESHQMDVTGATHSMFWTSLNIPAEQRLAQIEVTLERWRESRIEKEPYFVFVNIPDFHAEIWRDGQREMRFKIVAGNNNRECNPGTGTLAHVNATPMFNAEIQYLVFNPYWYVPERIRRDELDLELVENPAWLQENDYQVALIEGVYRVRQLPGEDNALGLVKFMLPNPYNVYMHDTPLRQYFRFPIRAFSHGCMRVENPMDFAEYILTHDGQWDPERIQRILESRVETTINLDHPVPIFVEYYVVRVDEEGRTNFLADIYHYDRDRLAETPPVPEPCTVVPQVIPGEGPAVEPAPAVSWQQDGSAILPDGTAIFPDGTIVYSQQRLEAMARQEQSGQGSEPDSTRTDSRPSGPTDEEEAFIGEPPPDPAQLHDHGP